MSLGKRNEKHYRNASPDLLAVLRKVRRKRGNEMRWDWKKRRKK